MAERRAFRDRVVHHALVRVIEPIFERGFIPDSYANRIGKGIKVTSFSGALVAAIAVALLTWLIDWIVYV